MKGHKLTRKLAALLCAATLMTQSLPVWAEGVEALTPPAQTENTVNQMGLKTYYTDDVLCVTVTGASQQAVVVTLYKDGGAVASQTVAQGMGTVYFSGLASGTYTAKAVYADDAAQAQVNAATATETILTQADAEKLAQELLATPTPTPVPTPTPEPTNTPTPEPTNTPTIEPTNTPTPEATETPKPEKIVLNLSASASGSTVTVTVSGNKGENVDVVLYDEETEEEVGMKEDVSDTATVTFTGIPAGSYIVNAWYRNGGAYGEDSVKVEAEASSSSSGGGQVEEITPVPTQTPTPPVVEALTPAPPAAEQPTPTPTVFIVDAPTTPAAPAKKYGVAVSTAAGTLNVTVTDALPQAMYVEITRQGGESSYKVIETGNGTASFTGLAAGVYSVYLDYVTPVFGSKEVWQEGIVVSGAPVVTATPAPTATPAARPPIFVNTIREKDSEVTARTAPGTQVNLATYDHGQTLIADEDGLLEFSLPHWYVDGTQVTFTVYYGSNREYNYKYVVSVGSRIRYEELMRGDTGSEVYDLTARLADLGYLAKAQNRYNDTVVAAVKQFQANNGLSVDGIAGQRTQTMLWSSSAVGAYEGGTYPTLERGDRGLSMIYTLQQRLKDLGYYTIRVDGIYGSGTQRAVRDFQAVNGLSVTGRADHTTQTLLYSAAAKPAGSYVPPSGFVTLSRSTRYDARVVTLQRRLKSLGYLSGSVDGYFGSQTYRAVRYFQQRNGITVTGVADAYTQQVLYSASAKTYGGSVSGTTQSSGYRLLYWGCKGEDVRRLQSALLAKGYTQVRSADGVYGQWTYDAVCAFQKANGLAVDGVAGKNTQNKLYGTSY